MAKIRIGFSTQFEVENEKVGIGTDSALDTLHVTGDIIADNIDISSGITTVTIYDGFVDKKTKITKDPNLNLESHTLSGEIIVEGDITVSSGTTLTSGPDNLTVTDNFTLPGISDDTPSVGDIRFNENLGTIQVFVGGPEEPITGAGGTGSPYFPRWRSMNSYVDMGNNDRGLIIGGYNPAISGGTVFRYVQTFNFSTRGNTTYFGTPAMTNAYETAGFGSKTRAFNATDGSYTKQIDYFILASQSNGIDFGELTGTYGYGSALSSQTRGIVHAGYGHPTPGANLSTLDYIEMETVGNATGWGDLTRVNNTIAGFASPTRGIFAGGGGSPSPTTVVDSVIIASKSSAIEWGNLTHEGGSKGASNFTRGIINNSKGNEAYQINSGGNSIVFGDLTTAADQSNVCASQTRVVIGGGRTPSFINTISYVTISTLGNAEDFGDLFNPGASGAACSASHGGLGGF